MAGNLRAGLPRNPQLGSAASNPVRRGTRRPS
jgi:hypothetical protein